MNGVVVEEEPAVKSTSEVAEVQARRELLRLMMLIRRFEERTYQEYTRPGQRIGGFCHLYSGQEAVAAGISAIFQRGKDYLVTAYRDHGHSLALGMEPKFAMAEMFGKVTGCSKGKGGSMHFFQAEAGNLGGHGIVGSQIPLGAGAAFAQQYRQTGGVSFTLFGDGAINQGVHNETLNLASLWKLPAVFIVENNHMAMGTQVERSSAERDLERRGSGYNMPYAAFDGNDIDEVVDVVGRAADRARAGEGPSYLVANTYRFRGHSMSDAMKYRSKEEMEKARLRDPIAIYEQRLRREGLVEDESIALMEGEIRKLMDDAVRFADQSPNPEPGDLFKDVYSETYPLEKT